MSRRAAGRWRFVIEVLLLAICLGMTRGALAASSLVVAVVRPRDPGPMVTEVVTRVRGELVAAGFQVALVDHVPGMDPGVEIRAVANRLHPLAIFGIFEQEGSGAADVWIADLLIGKTLVQRVEADARDGSPGKDGSSVQAVRAVELLRASLLELVVERSTLPPPAPPPRDVAETPSRVCPCEPGTPAPRSGSLGVEAGAGVLHSFDGIGPSYVPLLRATYQPTPRIAVRLTASAFGTRASVDAPAGQARVAQEFGLLELSPVLLADSIVRPVVSVGVGVYHLAAEGAAAPPFEASTQEIWTALFDAGAGARLAAGRHFGVSVEAHALFAASRPMVRIAQIEAGGAGRPSFLGSLTLVATP